MRRGVDLPLWRAAAAFRLVTVVYAIGFQIVVDENYSHRRLSWILVSAAVVWTGVAAVSLLVTTRRTPLVIADQVVTLILIASTRTVADPAWTEAHQVLPTTLWVTGAVISAAIRGGAVAGVASGLVMSVAIAVVRGNVDGDLWRDSTGPVLLSVGLALGLAARAARTARARLDEAVATAAAAAERERLAREVHDGVLQVLAMVSRRGHDIGGPTAELANLAAEQEVALRTLLSGSVARISDDTTDLASVLRSMTTSEVSVATPGIPVPLRAADAVEMAGAVREAVANALRHGGGDASVFVLVEDLGEEVVVGVRDDGVGTTASRIVDAEGQGRMGISQSIVGRLTALGGSAVVDTAPGEGVEWELRLPRR